MICPSCGRRAAEGDSFCTSCGTRLNRAAGGASAAPRAVGERRYAPERPRDAARRAPAPVAGEQADRSYAAPAESRPQVRPQPDARTYAQVQPQSQPQHAWRPDAAAYQQPPVQAYAAAPAAFQPQQPRPQAAPRPARPRDPHPWGSPAAAVLLAVACALCLALVAVLAFAPLVDVPLLGASSDASTEVVQTLLGGLDPSVSVIASGLLGSTGLTAYDAAQLALSLSGALDGSGDVALAVGVAIGAAAVVALFALIGSVASLLCRRASPLLGLAGLLAACAGAGGLVALQQVDRTVVRAVRNATSAAFAQAGIQLPEAVSAFAPTLWAVAVAVAGLMAFVAVMVSRHLWMRAHPDRRRRS